MHSNAPDLLQYIHHYTSPAKRHKHIDLSQPCECCSTTITLRAWPASIQLGQPNQYYPHNSSVIFVKSNFPPTHALAIARDALWIYHIYEFACYEQIYAVHRIYLKQARKYYRMPLSLYVNGAWISAINRGSYTHTQTTLFACAIRLMGAVPL